MNTDTPSFHTFRYRGHYIHVKFWRTGEAVQVQHNKTGQLRLRRSVLAAKQFITRHWL